ncbi:MAG: aldolase/citrate lyase family protein, partial [Acidimicrobiales bacterium]|nr:aldolase/citrate lyase family protein [Acidimicrobiales bacterium]
LTQVEKANGLPVGHLGIEVQIETARGLLDVRGICTASPRIEAVILGPADFAASVEMPVLTGGVEIPEYPGDHFHHVFWSLLLAARAAGVQVIDGPYLKIRELDGLRAYATRTRSRCSTRCSPPPRSSSTAPRRCSRPIAPPRTRRAAVP